MFICFFACAYAQWVCNARKGKPFMNALCSSHMAQWELLILQQQKYLETCFFNRARMFDHQGSSVYIAVVSLSWRQVIGVNGATLQSSMIQQGRLNNVEHKQRKGQGPKVFRWLLSPPSFGGALWGLIWFNGCVIIHGRLEWKAFPAFPS